MSDPFIGEIRIFGFGFTPEGWLPCDGSLLPIAQFTALFSLITDIYGGDGINNFAVPNFQGRIPITQGAGPSLSVYRIGQMGGFEAFPLSANSIPPHRHDLLATETEANTDDPSNGILGNTRSNTYVKPDETPPLNANLVPGSISSTGEGVPINNMQPYLCLNFCIAWDGIYPQRP